jgi:hypothetical protein
VKPAGRFLYIPQIYRHKLIWITQVWMSLIITAAATSFPVVGISPTWTWSRLLATFGIFTGLGLSSVMWSYVYMLEQVTTYYDFKSSHCFAVIRRSWYMAQPMSCSLKAISGRSLIICRTISMLSAALISVG